MEKRWCDSCGKDTNWIDDECENYKYKMRSFFKRILDNFHLYSGNRPLEKLSDEEVTLLLNILERVSKNYEYIPKDEQQKIIEGQLIADRTYYNLNARTVAGWLELNGKKYFKEVAHVPVEGNAKPLEGAERDAMLKMWQDALKQMNDNMTEAFKPQGSGSRIREQLDSVAPIPKQESALDEHCQQQAEGKTGDYAETKT